MKIEWSEAYWMKIFENNESLMAFDYASHYLIDENREKVEFQCSNSNVNRNLSLKLPFSWLVVKMLTQLTRVRVNRSQRNVDMTRQDSVNQLNNAFSQSLHFKFLQEFFNQNKNQIKWHKKQQNRTDSFLS